MSSFHNAISDTFSPLQRENSDQFDYAGVLGGFGQNGDYYDHNPDELPQSQRPPTEESQRPDASIPGGDTQILRYALGSQYSTAKNPVVGPSGPHAGLRRSQASLDALESQDAITRRESNFPKKKTVSSPLDPNWQLPSNAVGLYETPQVMPSYASIHSKSSYRSNYEQTSAKRGSGIFSQSDSNAGLKEPLYTLASSNDSGVRVSQPSIVAPVASSPTGGLSAPSPIFSVDQIGLHGTQTLVRATPSPPRLGPRPSTDTFPAPSSVGDTTTPVTPKPLAPVPVPAPAAPLARQETGVIPETPPDLPQQNQRIPAVGPPLTPPVVGYQESFVIPEPPAEVRHSPGPSSRKRGAPDGFEERPTPTKKTRRLSNESQKSTGVMTRVGAMRGRQETISPAKTRASARKPPVRISSPSKAIMAPRASMWDETLDDGFGRKAAETTAKKTKKTKEPPVRRLSDFGESQLVPFAVITPSGKTKPIVPPAPPSKKGALKEVAEKALPKKGKRHEAANPAARAKAQSEESESMKTDHKKSPTRSKVTAKDTPSSRRARKPKLDVAIDALAIDRKEGAVQTSKKRKAIKDSKSKKDTSPDSVPIPKSSFRLEIPTRKGQKRTLNEAEEDEPSVEVPPKKKRKAIHVETEDETPVPFKPSRKRKTSHDRADPDDVPQPPSKKRRNARVTVDEESSASIGQINSKTFPLASLPHTQSFAETATSIRSASQAPNRVFAKWGGNGMYYCGTLKKMGKREDGARVCIVEYDDGEVAHVPLEGLRKCEVWVGDVVEVPAAKGKIRKSATVASVDEWEEHGRVRVSVTKGKGQSSAVLEEVDIESRDVSVPAAHVEAGVSWTRRRLSVEDLEASVPVEEGNHEGGDESYRDNAQETTQETLGAVPTTRSRTKALSSTRRTTRTAVNSTTVSKGIARSTRRTPLVKKAPYNTTAGSKVDQNMTPPFAGDAFLIALSLSNKSTQRTSDSKDRERTKKRLQESITRQGGVYIEDWDDLLQLQGTFDDERRWIWEKSEDINYSRMQTGRGITRKRSNIDRVWVLADEPNRNTKYFTALALGVPCVGSKWVEDGSKYPWSSYLLPAGYSSVLGQDCVQIVNYDYADCSRVIKQLIDDPGSVRKPFAGKSLLFVGTSYKREKISEADFNDKHALSIIACLMGPARVEVVHDIKYKFLDTLSYDIIIWDTTPPTEFLKAHDKTNVIITTETWVKECLLTGTLLEV